MGSAGAVDRAALASGLSRVGGWAFLGDTQPRGWVRLPRGSLSKKLFHPRCWLVTADCIPASRRYLTPSP